MLGEPVSPIADLQFLLERRAEGTCDWIMEISEVQAWLTGSRNSGVLWLHATPATGKSVLMAYISNHLKSTGIPCQFFFFRFDEQAKRTPASLLISLATQIAREIPEFRTALVTLSEGAGFRRFDWRTIWKRVFTATLFELEIKHPIYWILDALDEGDDWSSLLGLLASISQSRMPIRILFSTRTDVQVSTAFLSLKNQLEAHAALAFSVHIEDNAKDIVTYSMAQLQLYTSWRQHFKSQIISKIVEQANGNFLWTYFVVQALKACHTEEAVDLVLETLPMGMAPLYEQMEKVLTQGTNIRNNGVAYEILSWAVFAKDPIAITELAQILDPSLGSFLDLAQTVDRVCGHFVVVDGEGRLSLVHQTAREYLTAASSLPFSENPSGAHRRLFERCISVFLDSRLRTRFQQSFETMPIKYRATSWAYHLSHCTAPADLDSILTILRKVFAKFPVLQWIHILASFGELQILISTSHSLILYLKRRKDLDASRLNSNISQNDFDFLETWSRDLTKIVGKFGNNLLQDPTSIYSSIPPFCPQTSAIHRCFGKLDSRSLRVLPLTDDWDDCLARIHTPGHQAQAQMLTCSGRYIAMIVSNDSIGIWESTTFAVVRQLRHEELIQQISFNDNGDRIAAYSRQNTVIWSVASGQVVHQIPNISDGALSIAFSKNGKKLLAATCSKKILRVSLTQNPTWERLDPSLLHESTLIPGAIASSPTAVVLNHARTDVAVAYRMFPLTVWSIEPPRVIQRCRRTSNGNEKAKQEWTGVRDMVWHPNDEEIIGIFIDGCMFSWNPYEDESKELPAHVSGMAKRLDITPDGAVIAVSDTGGTIRLLDSRDFSQLYVLNSEDIITGLSFSSDGRRFYDLRGRYCSVWEPVILTKMSISEGKDYEFESEPGYNSLSQSATEDFADALTSVKALEPRPNGQIVCVGHEKGLVSLYNYETGQSKEIAKGMASLSVEHLTWSNDGMHLAYCEMASRIKLHKIFDKSDMKNDSIQIEARSPMRIKPVWESGGVTGLLLNETGSLLLVTFATCGQLWSTSENSLRETIKYTLDEVLPRKWISVPGRPDILLSFSGALMRLHDWNSLKTWIVWQLELTPIEALRSDPEHKSSVTGQDSHDNKWSSPTTERSVERVIISHCGRFIIHRSVEKSSLHRGYAAHHVYVFETPELPDALTIARAMNDSKQSTDIISPTASIAGLAATLYPIRIPSTVLDTVDIPINILPPDRLVYLDSSFWLCTYILSTPPRFHQHQLHVARQTHDTTSSPNPANSPTNPTTTTDSSPTTTTDPQTSLAITTASPPSTNSTKLSNLPITRHFFIPRDWIYPGSLSMLRMLDDGSGTLLYPRKGKVAVIKSEIGSGW